MLTKTHIRDTVAKTLLTALSTVCCAGPVIASVFLADHLGLSVAGAGLAGVVASIPMGLFWLCVWPYEDESGLMG